MKEGFYVCVAEGVGYGFDEVSRAYVTEEVTSGKT